jgi:protein involved in polysaccharide export with SLBB domain
VIPSAKNVKHLVLALSALSLVTAGCTSGSSRGLSPFPQAHRLSDEAKQLRYANAPPLQLPRELDTRPLPAYTVEPGDVLLVYPADLDSPVRFPGEQPMLPDGTINLGKYGRLQVMGRTVPEIETLVRGAVQAQAKDAGFISVRLVAHQSKVYYVIGEVKSPGAFQLQGRETVLDAILQAGGLTSNASRSNIILSRPTRPDCPRIVLPVCWTNIVQLGDTATNYQIAPGDRIYVPTRGTLETIPGLRKHADKNLCCSPQTPHSLPPYPGGPCLDGPNPFQGFGPVSGTDEGPGPREMVPLPAPAQCK